jgi:hypothetical protein
MTMLDSSFLSVLTLAAVVIGGLGAILGGLAVVLHAVAPRTKTTVDDRLAADVDAAHDKLDELLGLLRGIVPGTTTSLAPTGSLAIATSAAAAAGSAPSTSTVAPVAPVVRNPQSGRVALGVMLVAALPVLMAVGIAIGVSACHTLGPAAASGLVAAIDCEAQHFSTQELIDATHLADGEVGHLLAGEAAPSTSDIAADLAPFDSDAKKCALAGILAGSTAALASSSAASSGSGAGSAVATQALSARAGIAPAASSAGDDPVQVRTAVSAAARQAGWPLIKVAGGTVL